MDKSENITVSAPGKVILHGEHAVVYGKRAIAACLDIRTFLYLHKANNQNVLVELPDIGLKTQWSIKDLLNSFQHPICNPKHPSPPSEDLLKKLKKFAGLDPDTAETKQLAVVAFLYLYCSICFRDGCLPSIGVQISSALPTSAGLGSSAAYASCLSGSFLTLCNYVQSKSCETESQIGKWTGNDLELINSWAFQAEKIIHGNPSGIDNSVSCYGGGINFQAGKVSPITRVPVLRVTLFNTKVPRSTKALVAGVRDRYNMYPDIIRPILDSIEAISQKCEEVFETSSSQISSKDYNTLQDLIDVNQHLLECLGVSHPALEKICQLTAKYQLKTKLTGAGGGGCAFTLIPPEFDSTLLTKIQEEIESLGYVCWETTVGGHGVLQHHAFLNGESSVPEATHQMS